MSDIYRINLAPVIYPNVDAHLRNPRRHGGAF
jgi:hypothetical protein